MTPCPANFAPDNLLNLPISPWPAPPCFVLLPAMYAADVVLLVCTYAVGIVYWGEAAKRRHSKLYRATFCMGGISSCFTITALCLVSILAPELTFWFWAVQVLTFWLFLIMMHTLSIQVIMKAVQHMRNESSVLPLLGGRRGVFFLLSGYSLGLIGLLIGYFGAAASSSSVELRMAFWRLACAATSWLIFCAVSLVYLNLTSFINNAQTTSTNAAAGATSGEDAAQPHQARLMPLITRLREARSMLSAQIAGAFLWICFATFLPMYWFLMYVVILSGAFAQVAFLYVFLSQEKRSAYCNALRCRRPGLDERVSSARSRSSPRHHQQLNVMENSAHQPDAG
jgi:hypothetical protein